MRTSWQAGQPGGFTLVELLTVLAILAILTTLAIPQFAQALEACRADRAATRICNDLDHARQQARAASAPFVVTFNLGDSSYIVARDLGPLAPAEESPAPVDLRQEPYYAALVSADFGGDPRLVFDGYGRGDSGGKLVLHVGQQTRRIILDELSGLLTVAPGAQEGGGSEATAEP